MASVLSCILLSGKVPFYRLHILCTFWEIIKGSMSFIIIMSMCILNCIPRCHSTDYNHVFFYKIYFIAYCIYVM